MLEDTIERSNWHLYPEFSGHGDRARLNIVSKLAVTAAGPDVPPPILFQEPNYFADLHVYVNPKRCLTLRMSATGTHAKAWHFIVHVALNAVVSRLDYAASFATRNDLRRFSACHRSY